jgi:hypothetical protein
MHSPCVYVELWWAIMVQFSYAMISITLSSVPAYWYVRKVGPAICICTISATLCAYVKSKRMFLSKNMSLKMNGGCLQAILHIDLRQWVWDLHAAVLVSPSLQSGCEIVYGTSDQHLSYATNSYSQAVGWSSGGTCTGHPVHLLSLILSVQFLKGFTKCASVQ